MDPSSATRGRAPTVLQFKESMAPTLWTFLVIVNAFTIFFFFTTFCSQPILQAKHVQSFNATYVLHDIND